MSWKWMIAALVVTGMLSIDLQNVALGEDAGEGSQDGSAMQGDGVWITSMAKVSDDKFVAATASGLLLRTADVVSFDPSNPSELTTLYSHPAAVWRVAATQDGTTIASVDYRGNLMTYKTDGGKSETYEKALERWCQAFILTPDQSSIIAGNEAGKILVWNLEQAKVTKSIELDGHAVTGLVISTDGSTLAACDGGGHVHLLKMPELESTGKIAIGAEPAWCVAMIDEGKKLVVGSGDRNLYQCDAKADAKAEVIAEGSDWITQIAVSQGGQIAAAEVGGRLHFPAADSMDAPSGIWSLAWNGDGQLLVGTRKSGIVTAGRSWNWAKPNESVPPDAKQPEAKESDDNEPKAEESDAKESEADGPANE